MCAYLVSAANQTPPLFETVIERFCRLAADLPNDLAIVFEDSQLTFSQLDHLASRIAHGMREKGVKFGDAVGLCIERRPEAIASMLAAFKIGAVFVPLDPEYPAERIRYMISDAAIRVIVTYSLAENPIACVLGSGTDGQLSPHNAITWLDCACSSLNQYPQQISCQFAGPEDLAYIMYTSGSTGMPKGVQIEHRALATYCEADQEIYQLTSQDRTLQFSTLNFDIAIEEIFPPLLTGGVVVVRPQGRSASHNELSSIIDQYRVTAIHIATAYWHEWVDLMVATASSVPASLRLVIATGEKVSVEHYRRWISICEHEVLWCNAYGPTETTVTATVFIPDEQFSDKHMPIGKPLKGYQAYILDDQYRPLGLGETGHLFIGGPILARGYLNQPEKTAAAFLTVDLPVQGSKRIYRTGDLARWLPSGDIEYAGRVDHQIKVGSYRIEPGEIEATLATFPGVLESVVVYEQVNAQKVLIAYVAHDSRRFNADALRSYLKDKLPSYMVPGRYVCLDSLPKTMNGKIDRKRLPLPQATVDVVDDHHTTSTIEQRMRAIWKEVLGCDAITAEDDFFALGGSSLLVTRVVVKLAIELGIELPVRDFFANPTLHAISSHIEQQLDKKLGKSPSQVNRKDASDLAGRRPKLIPTMVPCGRDWMFSVHYLPSQQRRHHAVLICNSLGHEQTRAYRNLQQLALLLAKKGFDVLRFDYRGTGNSGGASEMPQATEFIEDVEVAAEHLLASTGLQHLTVIGVRMGALFALKAKFASLKQMILWDPVFEGDSYVRLAESFHQQTLGNQSRFNHRIRSTSHCQVYGWETSPESLASLRSLQVDLAMEPKHPSLGLFSDDYLTHEPGIDFAKLSHHQQLKDQIGWHQLDYAERAFSSPQTFNVIIEQCERFLPPAAAQIMPLLNMPSLSGVVLGTHR